MARAPPSSLDVLSNELLLQIARHVIEANREHATLAAEGYYQPSQLDLRLFEVDRASREMLEHALSRNFAFIEIYFRCCQEHNLRYEILRNFRTLFQNARYEKLLRLRKSGLLKLEAIRIDVTCPRDICTNIPESEEMLVFTEATTFASMLVCNMIQWGFPNQRELAIRIQVHRKKSIQMLRKTVSCICRYLRDTKVTEVRGLTDQYVQRLTSQLNLRQVELGDLATTHKNHIRDMQTLLTAGTPVHMLVPLAWSFHRSYCTMMLRVEEEVLEEEREFWTYIRFLNDNNTDIMLRGIAEYLLLQPACRPHFAISGPYPGYLAGVLRSIHSTLTHHEKQQKELQEAALLPSAVFPRPELTKRMKVEEMFKTQTLVDLALARLHLFPKLNTSEASEDFFSMWGGSFEFLLSSAKACLTHVRSLIKDPLDKKINCKHLRPKADLEVDILTQALDRFTFKEATKPMEYPTDHLKQSHTNHKVNDAAALSPDLAEEEQLIYDRTRIWLRHVQLVIDAIDRASHESPEIREKGLVVIRGPLLHGTGMWGDIINLAPGESQKDKHTYISLKDVPDATINDFEHTLKDVMTEYTMPFYSDPETLEAVHESFKKRGQFD